MKYTRVVIFIIIMLIVCTLPAFAVVDYTDWEQTGFIRIGLGYNWLKNDFFPFFGCGLDWQYIVNLTGRLYRDSNEVNYSIAADGSTTPDIEVSWDNPKFTAQYEKDIRLDFSELSLAFSKNRIDGFQLRTGAKDVNVFLGKESYIPLTVKREVKSLGRIELELLDIPSSGDILDYSEVIIVNGEILTRVRDYSINYLSGKLQLFIPLEIGTIVESKFLFVPTNEQLAPEKGQMLAGALLTTRKDENYLSGFYFRRGNNINRVGGVAGQYVDGPFRLKGEVAVSADQTNAQHAAYSLDAQYLGTNLVMNYQQRNISPQFKEIGVNSFTKGNSQVADLTYRVDSNLKLRLEYSRFKIPNEDEEVLVTDTTKGIADYKLSNAQSLQFIVQNKCRQYAGNVASGMDYTAGYTYQTRPLTVSFGQSLKSLDNRYLKLVLDIPRLRINSNYNVELNPDNVKEHRLVADITARPVEKLDLNTYIEYSKPFGPEKGSLRLYNNGNWYPSRAWSFNGGYMYFNNPVYNSANQRYNLMGNYNKETINSNVNLIFDHNESDAARVKNLEMTVNTNMNVFKSYQVNYQILYKHLNEYMKAMGVENQNNTDHTQSIGLSHLWRDKYLLTTGVSYTTNYYSCMGIGNENVTYSLVNGFNYQPDINHLFSFDAGLENKYHEYSLAFNSHITAPLGKGKVDYVGKAALSLDNGTLYRSQHKVDCTFPRVGKVTPYLLYNNDYTNQDNQSRCMEDLTLGFKYNWKPKQYLYLQSKYENFHNWKTYTESYKLLGFYAGIEIEY